MNDERKPKVTLTGENGNAYNIMGLCFRAAKKAGWDQERIDALQHEMTSGDYDHLLQTAMRYFDVE